MTATLHAESTVATRTVTTRRPQFEFGDRLSQRHFAAGDLLTSHLVAVMSAIIPEGEDFVVTAVKRYRSDIEDPMLHQQANAFVGQETVHQREHERLNEVLRSMGYPMKPVDKMGSLLRRVTGRLSRQRQLAVAAAIEHWTAVIAEYALSGDRPQQTYEDEEFRAFLTWHLIEEIEHKSVAFDVMQTLGTTEKERINAMRLLIMLVGPVLAFSMLVSLALDRAAWNPRTIRRSLRWMKENSALGEDGFMETVRSWGRHGFHPDQRDHSELLKR